MGKERLGTRTQGPWDILRLMELQEILQNKAKTGRVGEFDLKFEYRPDGKVWYKPLDGFVPAGYTSLERVTAKITAMMELEGA